MTVTKGQLQQVNAVETVQSKRSHQHVLSTRRVAYDGHGPRYGTSDASTKFGPVHSDKTYRECRASKRVQQHEQHHDTSVLSSSFYYSVGPQKHPIQSDEAVSRR